MSRRSKKMEPAVMTLTLGIPVTNLPGSNFVDLSQIASLVNRRFYRQGINWAVNDFKFSVEAGLQGELTMGKLPSTWVMSNAWEKGMRAWLRMTNEAMDETEFVKPRFMDFKIYADSTHHAAGFVANLLPGGFAAGEWESSKMVIPNTPPTFGVALEREIIATGANYPGASLPPATGLDAVSLIEGYASSRALPNVLDPNTPGDADSVEGALPQNWIQATFNEGLDQDAQIIENNQDENNIAPYPFENDGVNLDTMYPNGANQGAGVEQHDYTNFTATSIGNISHMKGGMFPCGLIRIDHTNWNVPAEQTKIVRMQISLVPGHHRGYLCEPMTEM